METARIRIGGTARELAVMLATRSIEEMAQQAFAAAAEQLAETVRAALSTSVPIKAGPPPIDYEAPWLQTGALRDGVSVQMEGGRARIVNAGKAARIQEFGTVRVPPRPVLGPAAAAQGRLIADAVGQAVAAVLR